MLLDKSCDIVQCVLSEVFLFLEHVLFVFWYIIELLCSCEFFAGRTQRGWLVYSVTAILGWYLKWKLWVCVQVFAFRHFWWFYFFRCWNSALRAFAVFWIWYLFFYFLGFFHRFCVNWWTGTHIDTRRGWRAFGLTTWLLPDDLWLWLIDVNFLIWIGKFHRLVYCRVWYQVRRLRWWNGVSLVGIC